jgi:plasmid stability protein
MRFDGASRIMPRTTLDLDPVIIDGLRARAEREHKSMGQVASEALARAFATEGDERPPFEWKTHDMGLPLIDLEDKDALYRILDEKDAPYRIPDEE